MKKTEKKLLTIKEVSELLGVHQETLRRWDRQGKLKSIRIGELGHRRYMKEDIESILDRMHRPT